MRSRQLETALTEFIKAAAGHLSGAVAAGAEVPFEVGSRGGRRGRGSPRLYCYEALTGRFIAERAADLATLPSYAEAARLLASFDGLERYLALSGAQAARPDGPQAAPGDGRVRAVIMALLQDVFEGQTDFEVSPERMRAALERLEQSELGGPSEVTLVATLEGMAIASDELPLTKGLLIAHPDAMRGLPDAVVPSGEDASREHELVVVLALDDDDPATAVVQGRAVLKDLLRALRLFGDGRVTLGSLAWARVGAGTWRPFALGLGGRPHGMLVVTAEQEDELRAFCSLVSRRAPDGNELAWALRRFEMGCERDSHLEAVSDYLMALRVLLEPEGPSSGLLAGRLAALCATLEARSALTERTVKALELESAVIAGSAQRGRRTKARGGLAAGGSQELVEELARHLRALLRDVICGHLAPDLTALADELLAAEEEQAAAESAAAESVAEESESSPVMAEAT